MKEEILKLRDEGKTYGEIKKILGCSKSTISYYCGENQKEKNDIRRRRNRAGSVGTILANKWDMFTKTHGNKDGMTADDIIKKFGSRPRCYLTGVYIDFTNPRSFHFDHIIPKSRGGDNSLDNLGLTIREANLMKSNMTYDELIKMCRLVLKYYKNKNRRLSQGDNSVSKTEA